MLFPKKRSLFPKTGWGWGRFATLSIAGSMSIFPGADLINSTINNGKYARNLKDVLHPCLAELTGSYIAPPDKRLITCGNGTESIEINSANSAQKARELLKGTLPVDYPIRGDFPEEGVTLQINWPRIARTTTGITPLKIYFGSYLNDPRVQQHVITYGANNNRAFCLSVTPPNSEINKNIWFVGMPGAGGSALAEGKVSLLKTKDILDTLSPQTPNTRFWTCMLDPYGHGASGLSINQNGDVEGPTVAFTKDPITEWTQDIQSFVGLTLKHTSGEQSYHFMGQSTSAIPMFQAAQQLQERKVLQAGQIKSLTLVSPYIYPRPDGKAGADFFRFFFLGRQAYDPRLASWQKPYDPKTSREYNDKKPFPAELAFRQTILPGSSIEPSREQIEASIASTQKFMDRLSGLTSCPAEKITILQATGYVNLLGQRGDDVVDVEAIKQLGEQLNKVGCPTTFISSQEFAHNAYIAAPKLLAKNW